MDIHQNSERFMKSLYESILSSTKSGKEFYIKNLIQQPYGRTNELNAIWKSYDLTFCVGDACGKWEDSFLKDSCDYSLKITTTYKNSSVTSTILLAFAGVQYGSDIVISYGALETKAIKKTEIKKWAEKISRMLHMDIHIEKEYIYLNFIGSNSLPFPSASPASFPFTIINPP